MKQILPTLVLTMYLIFFFVGFNSSESIQKTIDSKNVSYRLAEGWPLMSPTFKLGNPTGIGIDSNGDVIIFHRANRIWTEPMPKDLIDRNTVVKLDPKTGQIKEEWGSNLFVMPHGLEVDKDDNVWVTDVGLHQVMKFDKHGNLLLTLGEPGVNGSDALHFDMPTDVAVASDGSFYVSDGYGNSRVMMFSSEGDFLMEWGTEGEMEGEFITPHGVDLDNEGNVYVADRENNRIQKFNKEGGFLRSWKNPDAKQLYALAFDTFNQTLFAIDFDFTDQDQGWKIHGSDIMGFSSDLEPKIKFGRTGNYQGPVTRYHDIAVDPEGNIYVGDILGNKVQKFIKE
ncbi:hypothetical protein E7Z59_00190 [Robertkochia marina]|uniref:Peptidylamidoglycolate lyase n=1 Tax=Robertkochia marina TaxID=1227945 RepID=A0A4S3M136_9FLAO|nr:peptidyl-alpha-hydroxyglycine alpha-amidating lyase family protein [Robertkochia marina]THD68784.1 hypothetical protein E7Z59_00190 [Robertkochia marina]TRZ43857.1 hypothetical protein D3A96_09840 [Robertkochia marina]